MPTGNFKTETTMINEIMRDFTNITELAAVYVDLRGRVLSCKYKTSVIFASIFAVILHCRVFAPIATPMAASKHPKDIARLLIAVMQAL